MTPHLQPSYAVETCYVSDTGLHTSELHQMGDQASGTTNSGGQPSSRHMLSGTVVCYGSRQIGTSSVLPGNRT